MIYFITPSEFRWLMMNVLSIFAFTLALGCSQSKAFQSGMVYKCNEGKSFTVELYDKVDIASVKIQEKRFYLPRVPSSSGMMYREGEVLLLIEGERASLEMGRGDDLKNCTIKTR